MTFLSECHVQTVVYFTVSYKFIYSLYAACIFDFSLFNSLALTAIKIDLLFYGFVCCH